MERYKLGELIDVTRGASLAGDNYATEGELVRLTLGNFDYQSNGFKQNSSKDNIFYNGEVDSSFILEEGDIITPLTEQAIGLLGSTAKIPESGKYIQSQDVALVKVKSEKLVHDFAYYLLPTASVKKQLNAGAQQTSIRHTSPDKIKDCTVYIPGPTEQQKIADFLNQIEEKIAINKKENETLEAMAKQLYDYWFIQFDFPDANGRPYKTSGGKMVWNETLKREIPEGWEDAPLSETLDMFDYKRVPVSSKDRIKGEYPYYGATGIMDYVNDYIFDGEYILLAEDGSTNDGFDHPIVQFIWGKTWVNNHAHILRPKRESDLHFTYYLLKNIPLKNIESGSIQKKVSQENLLKHKTLMPDSSIITRYCDLVSPFWDQYKRLTNEINILLKMREFILPLLMTGQVTIG